MFSKSSITKVVNAINARRAYYAPIAVDHIKMAISTGNRKIGRVMNVSLPPIATCANCRECMHYCYDVKACLQYPDTVIDARVRNLPILLKDREEYFSRIDAAMARRRKNKYFRWHVAGDIIDIDYFNRMINNARRHPNFVIWTYTKNYAVVNTWIAANGGTRDALPANLHIMFSEWRGLEMINPYGLPEFRVVFKADESKPDPARVHYCPGNCDICKAACRGCVAGETTYCNEH